VHLKAFAPWGTLEGKVASLAQREKEGAQERKTLGFSVIVKGASEGGGPELKKREAYQTIKSKLGRGGGCTAKAVREKQKHEKNNLGEGDAWEGRLGDLGTEKAHWENKAHGQAQQMRRQISKANTAWAT